VAPSFRLRVSRALADVVAALHPELKRKVRAATDAIRDDPSIGKELQEDLEGLRSLRVGRFRIVYRVTRQVIELVAVGERATIYQETLRLLRRERGEQP
jgi:mRNA interferase RelE/StbE